MNNKKGLMSKDMIDRGWVWFIYDGNFIISIL